MSRHDPTPPERTGFELGNRAPCTGCGHGLVACLRPNTDLRTYDGSSDALYWRHDRQDRVLASAPELGGMRFWEIAPDDMQFGPKAAIARANMRDYATGERW